MASIQLQYFRTFKDFVSNEYLEEPDGNIHIVGVVTIKRWVNGELTVNTTTDVDTIVPQLGGGTGLITYFSGTIRCRITGDLIVSSNSHIINPTVYSFEKDHTVTYPETYSDIDSEIVYCAGMRVRNPTPADNAEKIIIRGTNALKYLQWEAPE